MRIRKRKVPLPLSLLSPVPLSDPHLFSRSPVILVQPDSTHINSSSSSHLPTSIGSASDPRPPHITTTTTTGFQQVVDQGVQINNNDDMSNGSLPPPLPLRSATEYNDNNEEQVVGRWCDVDKAIPLKKRRGIGFVENPSTIILDDKEKITTTTTTTTTTILKWNNTNTEEKQGNDKVVAVAAAVVGKKGNTKRGNTIMEGSRCSRVNGRGWRCCQQTLVGYSLCEHHLGKGRLRSMTSSGSAKSRSSKKKSNNNNTNIGTKFVLGRMEETQESDETVDNNSDEKKLERMSSFGNSKRVKLGVVKARSLSSLLGQTNSMNNNNGFVVDHANLQHHEKISSLD